MVDATCDREEPDGSRRTARRIEDIQTPSTPRAIDSAKLLDYQPKRPVRRNFTRRFPSSFAHRIPMHRPFAVPTPSSHLFVLTLCMFSFQLLGNNPTAAQPTAGRPNIVWIIPDDMSANFSCYGETAIETPHVDRMAAKGVGRKQGAKQGATHILLELVIRSQLNCVYPCDFRQSIPASLRRSRRSSWKQADRSAAVTSATPLISRSAMKASRFSPKTGRADSLGRTTSPVRSGSPPERDSRACLRLA